MRSDPEALSPYFRIWNRGGRDESSARRKIGRHNSKDISIFQKEDVGNCERTDFYQLTEIRINPILNFERSTELSCSDRRGPCRTRDLVGSELPRAKGLVPSGYTLRGCREAVQRRGLLTLNRGCPPYSSGAGRPCWGRPSGRRCRSEKNEILLLLPRRGPLLLPIIDLARHQDHGKLLLSPVLDLFVVPRLLQTAGEL